MSESHIPSADRLALLVERLHETYAEIEDLVGRDSDALVHPASGRAYLLPDAQHELRHLEGVERRHAAERAAILDALPAQVALLDREGRIVAVNEAWRRFGRENVLADPDFSLGRSYIDVCEAARGPNAEQAAATARGIRRVLSGEAERFAVEYPCHAPDKERWFLLTVAPLGAASPSGAVAMHIEVTERHRAHALAEEMRQRFERLVDQARIGILVHRDFRPILVNPELARILGYAGPEEILAMDDCRDLFAPEEEDRVIAYNAARLQGDDAPGFYQLKGRRRNGKTIIMENRAFTIKWGDAPAVCAMMTDITAQLEMAEQLNRAQRLDALGQLTGGVAHDFNNLLTVILGNAELLAADLGADENLRRLAEMTANAAERGAELTSHLLAFSRRQPLAPQATDVNRSLEGLEPLLRRTLGEQVEIRIALEPGLRPAMIDPTQLENALLNLSLNARDAMPEGGELTIETAEAEIDGAEAARLGDVAAGDYVMVAVTDTGTGMDATTMGRVFEPFFTTKEVGKGSGLGLSMVYGFVKQSRGHVRLESAPGQGTTVRLYLPRAAVEAVAAETPADGGRTAMTGSERILLVEDDDMVRAHAEDQLVNLGYQVVAVADGRAALDKIEQSDDFDLLFTDVVMPRGMNGRQLAEKARALHPGLPVLFTSGYTEDSALNSGRSGEGVRLLHKPYRPSELAEAVRRVLEAARAGRPPSAGSAGAG